MDAMIDRGDTGKLIVGEERTLEDGGSGAVADDEGGRRWFRT